MSFRTAYFLSIFSFGLPKDHQYLNPWKKENWYFHSKISSQIEVKKKIYVTTKTKKKLAFFLLHSNRIWTTLWHFFFSLQNLFYFARLFSVLFFLNAGTCWTSLRKVWKENAWQRRNEVFAWTFNENEINETLEMDEYKPKTTWPWYDYHCQYIRLNFDAEFVQNVMVLCTEMRQAHIHLDDARIFMIF